MENGKNQRDRKPKDRQLLGIGRIDIKKGTPDALIRKMEILLINAELFIAWDGKGFVVNEVAAARRLLTKPIEIFRT